MVDLTDRARQQGARVLLRDGPAAGRRRRADAATRGCSSSTSRPTASTRPASATCARSSRRLADTGITVLLSSHNMLEVEEICTQVAIMRRGQIAFDGSMADLRGGRATPPSTGCVDRRRRPALEVCQTAARASAACTALGATASLRRPRRAVERAVPRAGRLRASAIRALDAPTTALETLFFRLTDARRRPGRVPQSRPPASASRSRSLSRSSASRVESRKLLAQTRLRVGPRRPARRAVGLHRARSCTRTGCRSRRSTAATSRTLATRRRWSCSSSPRSGCCRSSPR